MQKRVILYLDHRAPFRFLPRHVREKALDIRSPVTTGKQPGQGNQRHARSMSNSPQSKHTPSPFLTRIRIPRILPAYRTGWPSVRTQPASRKVPRARIDNALLPAANPALATALLLLVTPFHPTPPASSVVLLATAFLLLAAGACRSANVAAIRTRNHVLLRHGILRTRFHRLPASIRIRRARAPLPWRLFGYRAVSIRLNALPVAGSTLRIVAPRHEILEFLHFRPEKHDESAPHAAHAVE